MQEEGRGEGEGEARRVGTRVYVEQARHADRDCAAGSDVQACGPGRCWDTPPTADRVSQRVIAIDEWAAAAAVAAAAAAAATTTASVAGGIVAAFRSGAADPCFLDVVLLWVASARALGHGCCRSRTGVCDRCRSLPAPQSHIPASSSSSYKSGS
jgi:hypothetical protein